MGNSQAVGVAYSDPDITGGSMTGSTISGCTINNDVTGDVTGNVDGFVIFPTADPLVVGAWWNDGGTLTISAAE